METNHLNFTSYQRPLAGEQLPLILPLCSIILINTLACLSLTVSVTQFHTQHEFSVLGLFTVQCSKMQTYTVESYGLECGVDGYYFC